MKSFIYLLLAILFGTANGMVLMYANTPRPQTQQAVDLPEEYECIASRESGKPDTLLGFYDNDTVYITFKGNYEYRPKTKFETRKIRDISNMVQY